MSTKLNSKNWRIRREYSEVQPSNSNLLFFHTLIVKFTSNQEYNGSIAEKLIKSVTDMEKENRRLRKKIKRLEYDLAGADEAHRVLKTTEITKTHEKTITICGNGIDTVVRRPETNNNRH